MKSYQTLQSIEVNTLAYKATVTSRDVIKSGTLQQKVNDIHEGKWNGFGGKFEVREMPAECVIREVFEEYR